MALRNIRKRGLDPCGLAELSVLKSPGVRVIQSVEDHRLQIRKDGVEVVVACGDGDRAPDVFEHRKKLARKNGRQSRHHYVTAHGGAVAVALSLKYGRGRKVAWSDTWVIEQIREGIKIKKARHIIIYVHAPCAKAKALGLGLEDVVRLALAAKFKIRRRIRLGRRIKIACFMHVDYGAKKRTYYISKTCWWAWERMTRGEIPRRSALQLTV